jgi:hypothetical protein
VTVSSSFIPHVARWSFRQRSRLIIVDSLGSVVASYPIETPGDRPGHDMLWRNGWIAYPGAEWEEDPEGEWSRSVFPDCEVHRNGEPSKRKETR